jgi:O-antigen/teichoic acid export membrane protein
MLATSAYSLASVPIALTYLDVKEFGVWVLLLQLGGYFNLIELGMTGAAARLIVDHKDDRKSFPYIELLATSNAVFIAQAFLMFFVGCLLATSVGHMLHIPSDLQAEFVVLFILSSVLAALTTSVRLFGALLYAHQRLDLFNLMVVVSMGGGLLAMWASLSSGLGLYSLFVSGVTAWMITTVSSIWCCLRLRLLDVGKLFSAVTLSKTRQLFDLGRHMFALHVASLALDASQLIIVTRTMGLDYAAIWSVSTKLFTLVFQFVAKVEGSAVMFFAEMIAAGQRGSLRHRFRVIYQVSLSLAATLVAITVSTNQSFVAAWTSDQLQWSPFCNVVMGLLIIANCSARCGMDFIIQTKKIGALGYVYFAEAALFIAAGFLLAPIYGFLGILVPGLFCAIFVRGLYVNSRVATYLAYAAAEVGLAWLLRPLMLLSVLLPIGALTSSFIAQFTAGPLIIFTCTLAVMSLAAAPLFYFVGLTRETRRELVTRLLPKPFAR